MHICIHSSLKNNIHETRETEDQNVLTIVRTSDRVTDDELQKPLNGGLCNAYVGGRTELCREDRCKRVGGQSTMLGVVDIIELQINIWETSSSSAMTSQLRVTGWRLVTVSLTLDVASKKGLSERLGQRDGNQSKGSHCRLSKIMTLSTQWITEEGDPPEVFIIVEGGPVIEAVHAELANIDFVEGLSRLGNTAAMNVLQLSCSSQYPYGSGSLAENDVGARGPRHDDTCWMMVGVAIGPIDPAEGMCDYAGESGVVKSDGAGADDKDGGWGEYDSEAVIMLGITYIVKVCMLISFMRVTGAHNDTTTSASDSGSAFSFTPVNIVPVGDHSKHLHPHVMSHIVSTNQISLDTVISHWCSRSGINLTQSVALIAEQENTHQAEKEDI
ncbi:hypothetical protein ARMSODRAFT_981789 [Armillaria solidipes]|uniref:Uncharacterized protein n=1 Tax=Armillaria solidipes TaxID=1076256 RepID=A0A2H3BDC7_9AGAR|nr:hypothetical protein ARMSODRAFT_981789 [Armillaria solidipes]